MLFFYYKKNKYIYSIIYPSLNWASNNRNSYKYIIHHKDCGRAEKKEKFIDVSFPYAFPGPRAMVVVPLDTDIAVRAMINVLSSNYLASSAVLF